MNPVKFKDLWKFYPKEAPCDKKSFSNQCAIKVGSALSKCGVKTTTLVPKNKHCWHHKENEGHVLSANELAAGLGKTKIPGIAAAIEIEAANFKVSTPPLLRHL